MIIDKKQAPSAQYIGEIKANKVGIDTKNIDFIASLLTTNLYSNPIQSFLRETVSNGWDSHIEADNTEPVIVYLTAEKPDKIKEIASKSWSSEKENITIHIRDFGVGLSPERFANIYTNIGSSTKRDSNDFIGAFGIGRFSCLSCAESAILESYYNGTKYSYLMYKDGQGINIDELGQFPTKSKNGLKVSVTIPCGYYTVKEIVKAFDSLAFFNCIYIDDSQSLLGNYADKFNSRLVKHFNNFSIWKEYNHTHTEYHRASKTNIIVGNCIYPLDKTSLLAQVHLPANLDIYLRFNIGDIDITPNRESILYNPKTEAAIVEKARQVVVELQSLIGDQQSIDFPDIFKWYSFRNSNTLDLCLKYDNSTESTILQLSRHQIQSWLLPSTCTINKQSIPNENEVFAILSNIFSYHFDPTDIKFYMNRNSKRFYSKLPTGGNFNIMSVIEQGCALSTTDVRWGEMTKEYVLGTYFNNLDRHAIPIVLNKNTFIKHLKTIIINIFTSNRSKSSTIKNSIQFVVKNLKFEDYVTNVNTETIPKSYVTQWENNKKAQRKAANAAVSLGMVRKCVIYTLVDGSKYDFESQATLPSLDSELYTLNSIANKQGTTFVYTTKDDLAYIQKVYLLYNSYLRHAITSQLPVFIVVAPSNIITIANLANTISLDEYMNTFNDEFSTLSSLSEDKLSNIRSLMSSYHHTEHLQKEYSTLYNTIKTYYTLYNKYYRTLDASSPIIKDLITFIKDKYTSKNWLKQDIINIQSNTKLFAFVDWIQFIDNDDNPKVHAIIADYISRSGLSTLSTSVNKNYKQSDLFKYFI